MAIIGPLPNILQDGTVADAVPVMADFNWIVSQVNANAVGTPTLTAYALLNSPTFTGIPAAPTAAVNDNSSQLATDAFVQAQLANNAYAPLASPHLTGIPTAPTAAVNDNTTQLATDAFVQAQLTSTLAAYAPLASPALTGMPTAPTQAFGIYNTDIATTAFVENFGIGTLSSNYRNVIGSRSFGTPVTNTNPNPLVVSVVATIPSLANIIGFVSGNQISAYSNGAAGNVVFSVYFIVPPGAIYEVTSVGTLSSWFEW